MFNPKSVTCNACFSFFFTRDDRQPEKWEQSDILCHRLEAARTGVEAQTTEKKSCESPQRS